MQIEIVMFFFIYQLNQLYLYFIIIIESSPISSSYPVSIFQSISFCTSSIDFFILPYSYNGYQRTSWHNYCIYKRIYFFFQNSIKTLDFHSQCVVMTNKFKLNGQCYYYQINLLLLQHLILIHHHHNPSLFCLFICFF